MASLPKKRKHHLFDDDDEEEDIDRKEKTKLTSKKTKSDFIDDEANEEDGESVDDSADESDVEVMPRYLFSFIALCFSSGLLFAERKKRRQGLLPAILKKW